MQGKKGDSGTGVFKITLFTDHLWANASLSQYYYCMKSDCLFGNRKRNKFQEAVSRRKIFYENFTNFVLIFLFFSMLSNIFCSNVYIPHTYVWVSGGKKYYFFGKFCWRILANMSYYSDTYSKHRFIFRRRFGKPSY